MMNKKMNGTLVSEILYEELNKFLDEKSGERPSLIDISVGNDFGGEMYANMKKRKLEKMVGYSVESRHYDNLSLEDFCDILRGLNSDKDLDGIMLQLPLPENLRKYERKILECINQGKDVDGLTSASLGKLMVGESTFEPCTPKGIITLLKVYGIDLIGKKVCIINRSNIVGKPLGQLFLRENATPVICHSKTESLREISKRADILIAAMDQQEMIDDGYVKDGTVVIDVGVHKNADGKTVGDVNFDAVYDKCRHITPPVGGVGPMTICMLAYNTAKAKYGDEVEDILNKGIERAKILVKEF